MNVNSDENDDELEEEEQLVTVHLSGIIDMDYLKKCDASNCKVLGIDTDEPALQIDRMVFSGNYSESIGTNIIFEEQSGEEENGEVSKNLKYMCHTTKNLDMIRIFLKNIKDNKNTTPGENSEDASTMPNTEEEKRENVTDQQECTSTEMMK